MNLRILTAAALFILTTAAHAAGGNFERTLPLSGPADLYISTGSGHIRVFPGQGDQIHVSAHVYSGWNAGDNVEERIQKIIAAPPVQQSGNTVRLGETDDRRLYNNITIDYDISVPKTVAINARSGSGDVEIDNVGRFLAAATGSGSVRAHGIQGPAALRTGSGDVDLQEIGSGDVKAETGSGSIRINGLAGGLMARTGSGDIEANGKLAGDAKLQTGSGSIRLHLGADARFNFDAATGSGSIHVSQPGAPQMSAERHHLSGQVNGGGPSLEVRTGSGDIEVN
ncbi:DUF4097 domain-containing protein [Granulicella sp. WH15]|uniref:DUF4097 family beta strand repeat-containing protein n=1 Tax=Granulicella sp. WH15 TaxID=2602070 RepID=UPI00136691F2|nr:DUF4097 family beta strand repeat-containing protein [Granulicella sp. WH15]QHN03928.1 DUF4097 domain-containing protein [Granulicella sp. WH15]